MEHHLQEPSYHIFHNVGNNTPGHIFETQPIPFLTEDSLTTLLYPFTLQSFQQPMNSTNYGMQPASNAACALSNTLAMHSPPPAASPISSVVRSDYASSPRSGNTSPRPSQGKPEADDWNLNPGDLHRMGYLDVAGNWRCRYSGCCSSRVFLRACDLRKHFRGHAKYFFCAEKRCQQAGVGFATRKDFQRHMGSHRPAVRCMHPECDRIFSRKDNMREHYKKIHQRSRNNLFPRRCRQTKREESRQSASPDAGYSGCGVGS